MGFKRKTYGPVKPVKKAKILPPKKPSVIAYKRLLTLMKKSQVFRTVELLVRCTYWWQQATPWLNQAFKPGQLTPQHARQSLLAFEWLEKAKAAVDDKTKLELYVKTLNYFTLYASSVIKVPSVLPYVVASKQVTKNKKVINIRLQGKFDTLLTQLTSCFDLDKLKLSVVEEIKDFNTGEKLNKKFDQSHSTLYYSRSYIKELKQLLWEQGIMAVVLSEVQSISRALALLAKEDVVSDTVLLKNYHQLMNSFFNYCRTNPAAPKKLMKPLKDKKKKSKAKVFRIDRGALKAKILAEAQASIDAEEQTSS